MFNYFQYARTQRINEKDTIRHQKNVRQQLGYHDRQLTLIDSYFKRIESFID